MAGVKGRSGGPRKNAGGARPGAGRKRKPPIDASQKSGSGQVVVMEPQAHGGELKRTQTPPVPANETDMLTLLQKVALGEVESTPLQVKAAIAAVQYTHAKKGEGGKKEQKQNEAERVAGRFSAAAPPRVVAIGGRRV